jgi:hypothetical protein
MLVYQELYFSKQVHVPDIDINIDPLTERLCFIIYLLLKNNVVHGPDTKCVTSYNSGLWFL